MNFFKRILKYYIILALERAGVTVDSDMRVEMDDAITGLDAFITARIREEIVLHEADKHAGGAE